MKHLHLSTDARGVATVTIQRPEVHNAFSEDTIRELHEAFAHLDADAGVRVVVLASQGKSFCAGADIGWMQRAAANSQDANLEDARRFAAMMQSLATCRKPVVARVQGAAMGGGFGLVCAADIAIASTRARFAVSEARFGILPAVIGPYVVNAIGRRQAQRLALTCDSLDAAGALGLGLLHEVVDEADLDAAVARTVERLLAQSPNAQAEIKRYLAQLPDGPVAPDILDLAAQTIARVRTTDEAREGFAAFVEKRPAAWQRVVS
ncbi:enoyl-CoA hydratase-related protein [Amphibiibacter pelophylacis]|uniref:Enoyl-CoA hydratase-related protein n=1 Tax=Amphibiibacter pelophylacis TaxID=1799477 RepID=A0ACC6P055_9BURK